MPPSPLRQEDYLAIEAAVMETARGRWFLSEYARRNRNADTDTLLTAIDKLEKTIVRERAPSSLMNQVRMDLADMAAAIDKTKREIAQIKHEDNKGSERFERATLELDAIVSQTESATGDILGSAEKIQEYAWTLREQGVDEEKCNELDMEATNIYMACSFQDLTGQRIRKIVDAMRYVETRINKMIEIWGFESDGVEVDHHDIKRGDARPDAHLLNGPALDGEGVGQNDVDVLFDQVDLHEEADQDDVDALFDTIDVETLEDVVDGSDDVDVADMDAEAMAEGDVDLALSSEEKDEAEPAVDFDDIAMDESDVVAVDPDSEDDGIEFVDMRDLDWASEGETEAEDYLETVDPSQDQAIETEEGEADVFAAATVDEDDGEADGTDAEAKADEEVSFDVDEDASDADIFDKMVSDEFSAAMAFAEEVSDDEEPADLRDRVAQYS